MTLTPHELITGTIEIATAPEIFIQVNKAIDDPGSSASDIERIIRTDVSLAGRLLKIANSPFYGFPSQINTISRAITIIGTRELRDLVLATLVVRTFNGLDNDLISMEQFWRHSVSCAVVARVLAGRLHESNTERFFVVGLLHDIGSLIIYRKIPELAREALLRSEHGDIALYQAERDVIGFDHADVGGELMRKWHLPVNIQEAVHYHHTPLLARSAPLDAALTNLSNQIALFMRDGEEGDQPGQVIDDEAWQFCSLSADLAESVIEEADALCEESFRLFIQS